MSHNFSACASGILLDIISLPLNCRLSVEADVVKFIFLFVGSYAYVKGCWVCNQLCCIPDETAKLPENEFICATHQTIDPLFFH